MRPRRLRELLAGVVLVDAHGDLDVVVNDVTADSRAVLGGALFVATRGTSWDGHAFIAGAIAAGARAIVACEPPAAGRDVAGVTWVHVADGWAALASVAAAWYGHAGRDVCVLATTGTNGKTTTTFLLKDILEHARAKVSRGEGPSERGAGVRGGVGLISTVEVRIGATRLPTIFTTPPALDFQRMLAEMRDAGCSHAVVEASSHGLHQRRIAAFRVAVAGFSNLTRDHLDYHGTMDAYAEAKAMLFRELAERAAFNVDDAAGARLAAEFAGPKWTVSTAGRRADVRVRTAEYRLEGTTAAIEISDGTHITLSTGLIGPHNLQNAVLAMAMANLSGVSWADAAAGLAGSQGAPGRLQRVGVRTDRASVFVDYAHTPDALENVLGALRPLVPGRLVCVFGAGGDRDKGKRPQMAAVAARLADRVVVTSDTPRTEDAEQILDDIVAGFPAGFAFARMAERRAAIHEAIAGAGVGDAVLIAGKGHEDYQVIGATKHPFDDVAVAQAALEGRA